MINFKQKSGITLIALVITIVVLLILAGVSINLILGENGIVTSAKNATLEIKKAQLYEELQTDVVVAKVEVLGGSDKTLTELLVEKYSQKHPEWRIDVYEDTDNENKKTIIITTEDRRKLMVNVNNVTRRSKCKSRILSNRRRSKCNNNIQRKWFNRWKYEFTNRSISRI